MKNIIVDTYANEAISNKKMLIGYPFSIIPECQVTFTFEDMADRAILSLHRTFLYNVAGIENWHKEWTSKPEIEM